MDFATEELALMNILKAEEPEIGLKSAILGSEGYREVVIYEIGTMRTERMVRTKDLQTGDTRCFTERKSGRWIERGEAAKCGTPLIVGFPR
jgi:hypothetical protein